MNISDNILKIREKIFSACERSNRNPGDIAIVCVTKTIPVNKILEAINSGMKIIGENKIQETKGKYEALKDKTGFHFIGHLQHNKVKEAVKMFDMIQSIDSASLANALSIECQKQNKVLDILVEVKTSIDPAKYGVDPDDLEKILNEIVKLPAIRLKGLMTMADFTEDETRIRKCFSKLREIKNELTKFDLPYLSMGMTGDFEIAIEEGSNMIRIGSGIFKT